MQIGAIFHCILPERLVDFENDTLSCCIQIASYNKPAESQLWAYPIIALTQALPNLDPTIGRAHSKT